MTDTKTYPTLLVATVLCGRALGDHLTYSDLHDVAGWLYGAELWTHELAYDPIMDAVRAEGYRQFPNMPTAAQADTHDMAALADIALAAYGDTVEVEQGTSLRDESPIATMLAMGIAKEKIVAVNVDDMPDFDKGMET